MSWLSKSKPQQEVIDVINVTEVTDVTDVADPDFEETRRNTMQAIADIELELKQLLVDYQSTEDDDKKKRILETAKDRRQTAKELKDSFIIIDDIHKDFKYLNDDQEPITDSIESYINENTETRELSKPSKHWCTLF